MYILSEEPVFPSPSLAESNGLLAVGGDLTPQRLLNAYAKGIFPWYSHGDPILWWSPNPRMILEPAWLHQPRSLQKTLRKGIFSFTLDRAFEQVIHACAHASRPEGRGTWITKEMMAAYGRIHAMGYAHSIEAWLGPRLVGGVYGIALGGCFFGESMFYHHPDASKAAFVVLINTLEAKGFILIDCQMKTKHLQRFGAREVPRTDFLHRLNQALTIHLPPGPWS